MRTEVIKNPPSYDHDTVLYWGDHYMGKGYVGKGGGTWGLERCPECGVENYAMAVTSGQCYSCGWSIPAEAKVVPA